MNNLTAYTSENKEMTPDAPGRQIKNYHKLYHDRAPIVYLAGKMTGLSTNQARVWREKARAELEAIGCIVIDPTDTAIAETKPRVIIASNRLGIDRADLVLMELVYPKNAISIGTIGELFYAQYTGKPVIAFTRFEVMDHEYSTDYTEHPYIVEAVTGFAGSLGAAINLIKDGFMHLR